MVFRHPLIRQALYAEVPAPIRAALHEHAARTLAEAGVSWDRVARHLLAAPDVIDGWVLTWLDELPRAAAAGRAGGERRTAAPGPRGQLVRRSARDRFTARLAAALRMRAG